MASKKNKPLVPDTENLPDLPEPPPKKPEPKEKEKPETVSKPFIKGQKNKNTRPSSTSRTTWDHSAVKEARAARAKLDQVRATMGADAYSGDIGSYLGKANTVSALARQALEADRQGSVISSRSSNSDAGETTSGYDLGIADTPVFPEDVPAAAPTAPPKPESEPLGASDLIADETAPVITKNVPNPNKFRYFA